MSERGDNGKTPDAAETRMHILAAGRELLWAAKGALNFCCKYVESSGNRAPNVVAFFKKAMSVADDLSAGLDNPETIKKAARSAIEPVFCSMEREMAHEKRAASTPKVKRPKKKS